jgi:hypothetical protein
MYASAGRTRETLRSWTLKALVAASIAAAPVSLSSIPA